jgi:hypothetical protein
MEDKMKIALICAHPDLSNSGMLSVDLAFESLKKHIDDSVEVVRFCSWKSISRHGSITLHYEKLYDVTQLESFDKIMYWGDFLHWCKYGPSFMSGKGTEWYADENNISIDEAKVQLTEQWYAMYLLEGRPDLQKKAIVFGGTIYGIDSNQISNNRYSDALNSLYKNCRLVLMRDQLSAFYVSQLFEDRRFSYGCDCALLLDRSEIAKEEPSSEPYMVYSFGRCKANDDLEKFAILLAEKSKIKYVKISWLHPKSSIDELLKNLDIIRNAQFAVTDIYHLAINSWREQVPTLTVGRGNSYHGQGTLGDKKKEIFNSQILAMNYYCYFENVISLMNSDENPDKQINSYLTQLRNKPALDVIFKKIDSQVDYSKKQLISGLKD